MGILLGGHAFAVSPQRLMAALWLTIGTGAALAAIESRGRLQWFHQGGGLMALAKLALLCLVPVLWEQRLVILLAVVLIASVGSHMPARFRHYSVLYRQVIPKASGSGAKRETD